MCCSKSRYMDEAQECYATYLSSYDTTFWSSKLRVMRLCSIATPLAIIVLSACATGATPVDSSKGPAEEFENCGQSQVDGWRVSVPPAGFESILALPAEKGTIDSELGYRSDGPPSHEHWFEKDESHLAICRHLDVANSCNSHATFAYLVRVDGQWRIDGPVMETLCLFHERRR